MRLSEIETVLGREYGQTKLASGGWRVDFRRAEIKDRTCLVSIVAWGDTLKEARHNLANKLKGQTIVLNAHRATRQEITLPETISGVM